jgi:hypothetical protein
VAIARLAAHLPGQTDGLESLTEKFSQAQRFTIIDKLSVEEITSAFGAHLNPKILFVFLSHFDKIW